MTFGVLHAFFVLSLKRRRVIHVKLNESDDYPLLTAARKHKAASNLAAALLAGPQKRP
jgi:hypothetical protein